MFLCQHEDDYNEEQWDGCPIQGAGVGPVSTSELRDGARATVLGMHQLSTETLYTVPTEAAPPLSPPLPPLLPPAPRMGAGLHACLASLLSLNYVCLGKGKRL